MNIQLKSCAHCDGEASFGTVTYSKSSDFFRLNHQEVTHTINCVRCGIRTGDYLTQEAVAEIWNARHHIPQAVTEEMTGMALEAWLNHGGMPAHGGLSGVAMRAALIAALGGKT